MQRRIKFCIVLCFLLLIPAFLPAQTAAELESVLESSAVTCSEAAWFVYASSGGDASGGSDASAENDNSIENDSPEEAVTSETAFDWVMARGWLPKKTARDDPITLGTLSFLIMEAFDIKGGMMYFFLPGPRYAFRTMVGRSFIQGSADPAMLVSGERFLLILGRVLGAEEGEK